jgi:ABC-type branched-subunit amino acid transport system substrate-binding protein
MANLFTEALTARGGRVVAKVTYNRQSTDFFGDARRLKSDIDAVSSGATTSGAIAESGTLKTVDAVFIPDTFNGVNAAASALEFNQLTGMPLIGTNTWNDPGLSPLIGTTFPGSFFIDLYDGQAESSEVTDFTNKYRSSFGGAPGVLTAMGYDALMMLKASVSASGTKKFKSALASKGYKGVTGIAGFKPGDAPILRPRIIPVNRFVATTE